MRARVALPVLAATDADAGGVLPRITPDDPTPPAPADDPDTEPVKRRCGCCGSRLDRKGNVIERGAKWAEFLEADDKLRESRKDLAAEKLAHDDTRRKLTAAQSALGKQTARRFGHTASE
jgi:hypothetical protein